MLLQGESMPAAHVLEAGANRCGEQAGQSLRRTSIAAPSSRQSSALNGAPEPDVPPHPDVPPDASVAPSVAVAVPVTVQ